MDKKSLIISLIISVLLILCAVLGVLCYSYSQSFYQQKTLNQSYKHSEKVIAFAKLFIQKVIKANGQISFEDRLALENSVRATGDADIVAQWRRFTDATSEAQTQQELKNLLDLLVNKISY